MEQTPSRLDQENVLSYRPYTLLGRYHNKHFLLDNRVRDGKVGYEVLTPLELESGAWVLVNRGWVAGGARRDMLPSIEDLQGVQNIIGHFYAPDGRIPVLAPTPVQHEWPRRIQRLEWAAIEQQLGVAFLKHQEFRLSDASVAGAYAVGWPLATSSAEKHMAYAVQWFAMATALLILTAWATWRLRPQKSASESVNE